MGKVNGKRPSLGLAIPTIGVERKVMGSRYDLITMSRDEIEFFLTKGHKNKMYGKTERGEVVRPKRERQGN